MKKFEYEMRNEMDKISFDQLNKYGEDGWELCGTLERGGYIYYFKREITEEE